MVSDRKRVVLNIYYFINTCRILGLLLMPFSITMLPPILVAIWYKENTIVGFSLATLTTVLLGFMLWIPFKNHHRDVQPREAFLIVALLWIGLSLTGALPFAFSENPHMSYIDAIFETVSGLSTTGATVLANLDAMPRSLLYYRQQLQFIGGGGVIVLSIAILPMLSVGGMQLFRAEIPGPFKEEKLTPRITETAKTLWFIYAGLTIICALCYWAGGMNLFDAIGYSFSTVSTGGFGTHDDNFSYFNNPVLESFGVIFMLLGAINFSLHFSMMHRKNLLTYWQDPECRAYIMGLIYMTLLIGGVLCYYHVFEQINTTIIKTLFQVTSFFSTTGYVSAQFSDWPTFIPYLLLLLGVIGGCAGSTAGGIKMIRFLILKKQGAREIQRLIHPSGHYLIKLGYSRLHYKTLDAILGFFCIFAVIFMALLLLLLGMGLEPLTAFSALMASISNTGLQLNSDPEVFHRFSDPTKLVLCLAMLAGRLELFTLLVLFTPNYWRY